MLKSLDVSLLGIDAMQLNPAYLEYVPRRSSTARTCTRHGNGCAGRSIGCSRFLGSGMGEVPKVDEAVFASTLRLGLEPCWSLGLELQAACGYRSWLSWIRYCNGDGNSIKLIQWHFAFLWL